MSLTQRLISLYDKNVSSTQPQAIFGSVSSLNESLTTRAPIRIGMWPCTSEDGAGSVLGLWMTLAYTLEKWQDIRVYRLLARTDLDREDIEWGSGDDNAIRQFSVDDWHLDQLDENAAIWGLFTQQAGTYRLEVFLENDLNDNEEPEQFMVEGESVANILGQIDVLALRIAESLDAGRLDESFVPVPDMADLSPEQTASAEELLKSLGEWELYLYLFLDGDDWPDQLIQSKLAELIAIAGNTAPQFAAWCLGNACKSSFNPGLSLVGELVQDYLEEFPSYFFEEAAFVVPVGAGLYDLGYAEKAYDVLETLLDLRPAMIGAWLKLADLYGRSGRIADAVDAFQDALRATTPSASLYRGYGMVLLAAEQLDLEFEEFVLTDGSANHADPIVLEAIQSFEMALSLRPDDISVLHRILLQSINLDVERFWLGYEDLVRLDEDGLRLRDITESLYELEDPEPAIEILEQAIQLNPERFDLYTSTIVVLNLLEDYEASEGYLQQIEQLVKTNDQRLDLSQLKLNTQFPEFEREFSDIAAVLSAGNKPSSANVDFLEEVVDIAPDWPDGYVALGKSYMLWGDQDEALEVLLDAQKQLPDDPNIAELLGQVLWAAGERELALEYLNKGLEADPNHLPLLVRVGWFLFDSGQYADARMYIARAELLNPRDAQLGQLKVYIANRFAEQPEIAKRFQG